MNNRHLRSGIFFISIGVIFLLVNFSILDGYSIFRTVLEYWPAIFIVIGINVIFRKYDFVRIATWLLFLGAIILLSYYNGSYGYKSGQWITSSSNVKIEKNISTERGTLNIGLGGTKLMVDSTGSNLVDAYISNPDIAHREDYSSDKKNATVEFKNDRNIIIWPGSNNENRIDINDGVIWDMNIDTGAADAVIDMTNLKVENLEVKTGAASFNIIFGSKYNHTEASIKAGASSFDITVPEDSGVRVDLSGALVGNNLDELGWSKENNFYTSPNYNSAANKIDLDIDMGLGSFNIKEQ